MFCKTINIVLAREKPNFLIKNFLERGESVASDNKSITIRDGEGAMNFCQELLFAFKRKDMFLSPWHPHVP